MRRARAASAGRSALADATCALGQAGSARAAGRQSRNTTSSSSSCTNVPSPPSARCRPIFSQKTQVRGRSSRDASRTQPHRVASSVPHAMRPMVVTTSRAVPRALRAGRSVLGSKGGCDGQPTTASSGKKVDTRWDDGHLSPLPSAGRDDPLRTPEMRRPPLRAPLPRPCTGSPSPRVRSRRRPSQCRALLNSHRQSHRGGSDGANQICESGPAGITR